MKITQETRAALLADLLDIADDAHEAIWERDTILLSAVIPAVAHDDRYKTIQLPRITRALETVKMPQIITIAHLRRLFGVGIGE